MFTQARPILTALILLRLLVTADRPSCQHKPAPDSMTQRYNQSNKATSALEEKQLQSGVAGSILKDWDKNGNDTAITDDKSEEEASGTTTDKIDENVAEEVTTTTRPPPEENEEKGTDLQYLSFTKYNEEIKGDVDKFEGSAQKLDTDSSKALDESDKYGKTLKELQDTSKTFKQVVRHFGDVVVEEHHRHVDGIKEKLGSAQEMGEGQEGSQEEHQETGTVNEVKENLGAEGHLENHQEKLDTEESRRLEHKDWKEKGSRTTVQELSPEDQESLVQKLKLADIDESHWNNANLNLVLSWDANTSLELALVQSPENLTTENPISISSDENKHSQRDSLDDGIFEVNTKKPENSAWITTKTDSEKLTPGHFDVFIFNNNNKDGAPAVDFQCLIKFDTGTGEPEKAVKAVSGTLGAEDMGHPFEVIVGEAGEVTVQVPARAF